MKYDDIKIFRYKKVQVVFTINWKKVGVVKKELTQPLPTATPKKTPTRRIINASQKFYNVESLFKQ